MIDSLSERIWQAQLDRLRAELAVPACAGDCRNCPLNTNNPAPRSEAPGAYVTVGTSINNLHM